MRHDNRNTDARIIAQELVDLLQGDPMEDTSRQSEEREKKRKLEIAELDREFLEERSPEYVDLGNLRTMGMHLEQKRPMNPRDGRDGIDTVSYRI